MMQAVIARAWQSALFALAMAGLLAPFAAAAQVQPDPPAQATASPPSTSASASEQIVVIGKRMHEVTNKFVHTYTAPSAYIDQISRWRTPLCIKTVGLPPNFNAFITRRIKEVAAQIRAPKTKDEPCFVDIEVIFSANPQELLDKIARDKPGLLGPHYPRERKKLATMTDPIQAWYATATADTTGTTRQVDTFDTSEPPPVFVLPTSSWIQTGLTSEFTSIMVIVDYNKIEGSEIGTIADYIAMKAFARAKTSHECQQVPSITNTFENCGDGVRATALSDYDMAYLKALYATPSDLSRRYQASEMGLSMQRSLEKQIAERKSPTDGPAK